MFQCTVVVFKCEIRSNIVTQHKCFAINYQVVSYLMLCIYLHDFYFDNPTVVK